MIRAPKTGLSPQELARELKKVKERIKDVRNELEELSGTRLQEFRDKTDQDIETIHKETINNIKALDQRIEEKLAGFAEVLTVNKDSIESLAKRNEELVARNAELEEKMNQLESSFSSLIESHSRVIDYLKTMGIHYEERKTTKDIFNDFLSSIKGKSSSDALRILQDSSLSARLVEIGYSAVKAKNLINDLENTFLSVDRITDEVMVKIKNFFSR